MTRSARCRRSGRYLDLLDHPLVRLAHADRSASRSVTRTEKSVLNAVADAAAWANGVPIWAGAGAALAITGKRGRAVALRAGAAMALASACSNLVVKRLVPRSRPLLGPRRGEKKSSSAFPSSHAASASAFAATVSLEWPEAGLPVVAVAVVVAASRVYARQHHVGDVLAGLALGAGAGLVVHRLAPVAPSDVPSVTDLAPEPAVAPDQPGEPAWVRP